MTIHLWEWLILPSFQQVANIVKHRKEYTQGAEILNWLSSRKTFLAFWKGPPHADLSHLNSEGTWCAWQGFCILPLNGLMAQAMKEA